MSKMIADFHGDLLNAISLQYQVLILPVCLVAYVLVHYYTVIVYASTRLKQKIFEEKGVGEKSFRLRGIFSVKFCSPIVPHFEPF